MHTVSKFKFFIHIIAIVKLKTNKSKTWKGGGETGKKDLFLQLFQIAVSPWIQASI